MASHKRLTTFQKATALVPLALLSGAWTTSLTMTGSANADGRDGRLPDGTTVPDQAIKAPPASRARVRSPPASRGARPTGSSPTPPPTGFPPRPSRPTSVPLR